MSMFGQFVRSSLFTLRGSGLTVLVVIASVVLGVFQSTTHNSADVAHAHSVTSVACSGWSNSSVSPRQGFTVANGLPPTGGTDTALTLDSRRIALADGDVRQSTIKSRAMHVLTAEGDAADHIVALAYALNTKGSSAGLAAQPCRAPSNDWWFAGINTVTGYTSTLTLLNPDNADTVATLTAYTKDGERPLTQFGRVVVRANSVKVIDLNLAFPGIESAGLHVHVVDGRVTANVQMDRMDGFTALGRTTVPPVTSPSTEVVMAGIGEKAKGSLLHIFAPDSDATVTVTLHSSTGTFDVASVADMDFPAGKVRTVDLASLLDGAKASVVVTADVPIVAAVSMSVLIDGKTDIEVLGGQANVASHAVIAIPDRLKSLGLQAFSPKGGTVIATAFAGARQLWSQTVDVSPGTMKGISLPSSAPGTVILLTGDTGDLYITQWLASSVRGGGSAAVQVFDPSAEMLQGARLQLRTT